MTRQTLSPMQRVVTTLSHKEPDRVTVLLTVTLHGAQELGVSIKEYFSRPENVAEGQLRLREIYQHDAIYAFFYAAVEVEAWGSEVIYVEDGPPNAGEPFLRRPEDIATMEVPNVKQSPSLLNVLRTIAIIKARVGDEVPIVGVVMAPLSLPIMQLGFERYIELMHERPELFERLMRVNEAFCVAWANAQLEAGATAIGYFDPVSSPTIIPRDHYRQTGFPLNQRVLGRIQGPTATLLASGRVLPILGDILQTPTTMVGASTLEDLAEMKAACRGRATVVGNLNAIEMCRWTPEQAEAEVKRAIAAAAPGGGFILCDNHEIPYQVPGDTLHTIVEAAKQWGNYPLDWVPHEAADVGHRGMRGLSP